MTAIARSLNPSAMATARFLWLLVSPTALACAELRCLFLRRRPSRRPNLAPSSGAPHAFVQLAAGGLPCLWAATGRERGVLERE